MKGGVDEPGMPSVAVKRGEEGRDAGDGLTGVDVLDDDDGGPTQSHVGKRGVVQRGAER